MPGSGKGKAISTAMKYGPVVYAAAKKYGPQLVEQAKQQREPVEKVVQRRMGKGSARRSALTHAGTVVEGSVLQVFHESQSYWVVFSGDEPIGTHPWTAAPYVELLRHADLSKRVRPTDAGPRGAARRGAARRGAADRGGARRGARMPRFGGGTEPGSATGERTSTARHTAPGSSTMAGPQNPPGDPAGP